MLELDFYAKRYQAGNCWHSKGSLTASLENSSMIFCIKKMLWPWIFQWPNMAMQNPRQMRSLLVKIALCLACEATHLRARTARPSPASRHRRAASPRSGKSKPADHLGSTPRVRGTPKQCWGVVGGESWPPTTTCMWSICKRGSVPSIIWASPFWGFNTHETSSLLLGKCSFHAFLRFVPEVQKN